MAMDEGVTMGQPPEPESPAPVLGFGGKLWNLFFDPRKTFGSVRPNHEWIILWILTAAISIGAYLPIKSIVIEARMTQVQEQLEKDNVPPEQREETLRITEAWFENPALMALGPVFQLIFIVIIAGILLFIGNILLGGNASYLKMLNAYAWTMMVAIPTALVTVPLVKAKESLDVSIGLGVLVSPDTGAFLKTFISSFELFALWQVWLSSIAVTIIAGVDSGKAIWAVFGFWLLWILAKSGLATIGIDLGM